MYLCAPKLWLGKACEHGTDILKENQPPPSLCRKYEQTAYTICARCCVWLSKVVIFVLHSALTFAPLNAIGISLSTHQLCDSNRPWNVETWVGKCCAANSRRSARIVRTFQHSSMCPLSAERFRHPHGTKWDKLHPAIDRFDAIIT